MAIIQMIKLLFLFASLGDNAHRLDNCSDGEGRKKLEVRFKVSMDRIRSLSAGSR